MATEPQGFQHPIPGQWNREGTCPAVSPWVLEAPLWGPASHQQREENCPQTSGWLCPCGWQETRSSGVWSAWERSGPQPWARGQALLLEHGVPSCSSPPFVGTAYPHHPSGITVVRSSMRANRQLLFQFQLFFCTSLFLHAVWSLSLVTAWLQEATQLTRPPSGWSPVRVHPLTLNSYSVMKGWKLQEFSTTAEMWAGHLPLGNSITATCAANVFIYSQIIYSIFFWWAPGLFSSLFTSSPYCFLQKMCTNSLIHALGKVFPAYHKCSSDMLSSSSFRVSPGRSTRKEKFKKRGTIVAVQHLAPSCSALRYLLELAECLSEHSVSTGKWSCFFLDPLVLGHNNVLFLKHLNWTNEAQI